MRAHSRWHAAALALLMGGGTAWAQANSQGSSVGVSVYPARGQSASKQQKDESECYAWAKRQTGIDPNATAESSGAQGKKGSGAARGAAEGGAIGTGVGIVTGHPVKGAAAGAGVGAATGYAKQKGEEKGRQEAATQD